MTDAEKMKARVDEHAEDFEKWWHKKWVVMPTGAMAVKAWIDYWYEVIDKGE